MDDSGAHMRNALHFKKASGIQDPVTDNRAPPPPS
jgi:hypothetical protein